MEEVSLIDSLAELLKMPEKWMIQDDEGKDKCLPHGNDG
jgi:hypothetical protein